MYTYMYIQIYPYTCKYIDIFLVVSKLVCLCVFVFQVFDMFQPTWVLYICSRPDLNTPWPRPGPGQGPA